MELEKENLKKICEAILFSYGDPISYELIATTLEITENEAKEIISELKSDYDYDMRGLCIIELENTCQMVSRSEYFDYVKKAIGKISYSNLSQAALETLAIIAYKQPISRSEIEFLRGVTSSSSLDLLLDKGFVKEAGKLDTPGRPTAFATTDEFLKFMNIRSIDELPEFESFTEGIQMTLTEAEEANTIIE